MILVSQISPGVHDNSGSDIWWRDETLRGGNAESHSFIENYGQKVGNGVSTGGCKHEKSSETPHFQVQGILEVFPNQKWFRDSVVTVLFNSCDNECRFFLVEEL